MTYVKDIQHLLTRSVTQLLMVVVMTGPLLALTTNSSSPNLHLKETHFDIFPTGNVLFEEDVLQEVSARSRIECSKKCVETEGCVMCTFHSSPEGPPGLCRLHSQLQKGTDDKRSRPGARSMARRFCDGGYVFACGHCLKAVKRPAIYVTAREGCEQMQGQLAMVSSTEEIYCFQSFGEKNDMNSFWLGAANPWPSNQYRWIDGTLLPDNSSLWDEDEPSCTGRCGKCVRFPTGDKKPGLRDSKCNHLQHYMCQRGVL